MTKEQELSNLKFDLDQIKSRLHAVLANQIKKSVENAIEAIELKEPRIKFISQELNTIDRIIEKELKWLRSLQ